MTYRDDEEISVGTIGNSTMTIRHVIRLDMIIRSKFSQLSIKFRLQYPVMTIYLSSTLERQWKNALRSDNALFTYHVSDLTHGIRYSDFCTFYLHTPLCAILNPNLAAIHGLDQVLPSHPQTISYWLAGQDLGIGLQTPRCLKTPVSMHVPLPMWQ